ncbi:hypothetical protein RDI58_011802 [Solanum bulbocastanum]|uniref:Cytochrome P450 n=1 Tax=Solanum bulbocastanum TaxID=147425 RepID=A0AAN8TWE7_SOLBU
MDLFCTFYLAVEICLLCLLHLLWKNVSQKTTSYLQTVLSFNYKIIIWASYGYLWRVLRRLTVNITFSSNCLCKSSALRSEEIEVIIRGLFKDRNKNGSSGAKVNLSSWVNTYVFNFTMRICTGKRCVSEEDIGTEKGKQIIEETRGFMFAAFALILNVCDFLPVLKWFRYKGIEKSMVLAHKKRNEFFNSLLDEFRHKKESISVSESSTSRNSDTLVETLLSLQESELEFYTNDLIKSALLITSMTIQWAMRLLLTHPEAFHKCVINETLRIYPPVPLLFPHYSLEDCTVGGYNVPKHTILMVKAWPSTGTLTYGMSQKSLCRRDLRQWKGKKKVSIINLYHLWFDWESVEIEENLDACYDDRINLKKDKPLEANAFRDRIVFNSYHSSESIYIK